MHLLVSPVTTAEIHAGLRPDERETAQRFLGSMVPAPLTREIGEIAGELLRRHGKRHGLRLADALIAATAMHSRAQLFTLNIRHFEPVDISLYVPRSEPR